MTPERLEQIQDLYLEALAEDPAQRAALLEAAGADDPILRTEVESLLQADPDADAFLDVPVAQVKDLDEDAARSEPLIPKEMGAYRIEEEIGRGGMGQVYLARRVDGQFDRQVALKVIRPGLDSGDVLHRFFGERQILARLRHPHIAHLYDGGLTGEDRPYFAMEYVAGQPLTAYCDAHQLRIDERLRLFQDVCSAVQYAHRNLVVHRDLKPSNILVTDDGTVKLLDFGIAKVLSEGEVFATQPVTQTGVQVMTPEYATPEQVNGDPITTATDIWALGAVLYVLLTGYRPFSFDQRTPSPIARVINEQQPMRPSAMVMQDPAQVQSADILTHRQASAAQLQKTLSGDLDTILLKTLRKEPERRYPSAEALADDLRRYLAGQPVTAQPDTMRYRFRKFVSRHRVSVAAGVVVLLSLITGLTVALWQAQVAAAERDRVRLQAEKTEAVKDFLLGVFLVSDPGESRGASVTALELLDEGATRIDTDLDAQPAIRAELMGVLGEVYNQLGLYEKASPLLERSLTVQEALEDAPPDVLAESLRKLAMNRYEQGAIDEAIDLLRRALALQQA